PPSFPAAQAWLAPFPPGSIWKSRPVTVWPAPGSLAICTTKSMLRLPATAMGFFMGLLSRSGGDDERQADHVAGAHHRQELRGPRRRGLELLPDKDAPQGGDQRGALAQAVGDGRAGLGLGDDAERHPHVPDHPSEDADQVEPCVALLEVIAE